MTDKEVQSAILIIKENESTILKELENNFFIYNEKIQQLIEENAELRSCIRPYCKHKFVNGYCDYCGKEE